MERECKASASAENKLRRKRKEGECDSHPKHPWCPTCRAGHRKKAYLGPVLSNTVSPAELTQTSTMSQPLRPVKLHTRSAIADKDAGPVRASAGKDPVLLTAEYPNAERHIRDNQASTDVANAPSAQPEGQGLRTLGGGWLSTPSVCVPTGTDLPPVPSFHHGHCDIIGPTSRVLPGWQLIIPSYSPQQSISPQS